MYNQQYSPTLLDVPISFFKSRNDNTPAHTTTLRRMASTRYYQQKCEAIRAEPQKAEQDKKKSELPAITPVALLHHRKKDTSFAEKINQQWPMLMGDIDLKENPGVDMAELKYHLSRLRSILLCAYSVRGGLWFVMQLPDHQTPDTLAAHFRYVQKWFGEKFGVKLDTTKGGNPTDLRYASDDEAPYLNDNATVMPGTYTPPPAQKPTRQTNGNRFPPTDEGQLLTRIMRYTQGAGEGERHATLLKAANLAGGFIAAGRMDEQTAVQALETVASEWPTFSKSQKTIRDGIRNGLKRPITEPAPPHYPPPARTKLPTPKPLYSTLAASSFVSPPQHAPLPETSPAVVTTVGQQRANPGAILRPHESEIERLTVEPCDYYPAEWDSP